METTPRTQGMMKLLVLVSLMVIGVVICSATATPHPTCINIARHPFIMQSRVDTQPVNEVHITNTPIARTPAKTVRRPDRPAVNLDKPLTGCQTCCGIQKESDSTKTKKMQPKKEDTCALAFKGYAGHCCGTINGRSKCCPNSARCVEDRVHGRLTGYHCHGKKPTDTVAMIGVFLMFAFIIAGVFYADCQQKVRQKKREELQKQGLSQEQIDAIVPPERTNGADIDTDGGYWSGGDSGGDYDFDCDD